jgi:hypothetical protein
VIIVLNVYVIVGLVVTIALVATADNPVEPARALALPLVWGAVAAGFVLMLAGVAMLYAAKWASGWPEMPPDSLCERCRKKRGPC